MRTVGRLGDVDLRVALAGVGDPLAVWGDRRQIGFRIAGGSSCQVAFLFTSTAAGSFAVSATPASSNGGSAATASNSLQVDAVFGSSASVLSVSPSPALAGAGVTVTATVEDRFNNLISGATVTFSAVNSSTGMPSATASFTVASGPTVNGVLASVLTDTVAEPLTVTAAVSGPVTGMLQNTVTFVAPSYTVTTLVDPASGNGTPGNRVAAGLSGGNSNCSQRDAVAAANALSGMTAQIGFAPALTAGATTASPAILAIAQSTPITLSASMNLNGPGANLLTIKGGAAPYNGTTQTANYQVFGMTGGTSTISGVTVANGYLSGGGGGGGMRQTGGALTVCNSNFSGDSSGIFGGAIYAYGQSLAVSSSTFYGNSAESSGGAIYAIESAIAVSESTFYGNYTDFDGGGALAEPGAGTGA